MEHNVVTLETAKKLKQAGFSQFTIFYHLVDNSMSYSIKICQDKDTGLLRGTQHIISAPTAQEIADELPKMIEHESHHYWLRMQWPLTDSSCQYWSDTANERLLSNNVYNGALGVGDTMAESLADLWLTLKKQEKLGKINFSRE